MIENRRVVVYLEVTSHQGISLGAWHFYGKLVGNDENGTFQVNDLVNRLTERHAAKLNKAELDFARHPLYKTGQEYTGFEDKERVIDAGRAVWQNLFPNGRLLILGKSGIGDPQTILIGPGHKLCLNGANALVDRCSRLRWYENPENVPTVERLCGEWFDFVNGILPAKQ